MMYKFLHSGNNGLRPVTRWAIGRGALIGRGLILLLPLLSGCADLPFRLGDGARVAPPPAASNNSETSTKRTAEERIIYRVKQGDTLYSLAKTHGQDVATLAETNRLKITDPLRVGQPLTIIVSSKDGAATDPDVKAPSSLNKVETVENKKEDGEQDGAAFVWPLKAFNIGQGFGITSGGIRQEGLSLEAPLSAPVYAAASGEVIYVGKAIKSLGLLVLIKHNGGFVSTYGHLQRATVKKGDRVPRGQMVGVMGDNNGRPQLYFEIRKNNQPLDPIGLLPKK